MKKIFTLFAALAMVMSMSAVNIEGGTKLYLTPNGNWKVDNARFAAYFFVGETNAWASMTPVAGETDVYELSAPTGSWEKVIFCRMNPSATENNWDNKWNQTKDLTYDGTKNHCIIEDGAWDDCGSWVVYGSGETPEPQPEPTGYYIAGPIAGGWSATQLQLTENNGVYTHTFTGLVTETEYTFKVTNGTWEQTWGINNVKNNPYVYGDKDGNVVFKMAEAGDVVISFDGSYITVTGNLAEVDLPSLVYSVTVPEGTNTCYIAGAMTNWGHKEMTKVDATHYTIEIKGATADMKYKYCSGPSWDYEEVTAEGGKVEDRAYSENDVVVKWKAVYVTPSTAVDNVTVEEVKAVKVIRNGQLYILRDGVMYNAVGQIAE